MADLNAATGLRRPRSLRATVITGAAVSLGTLAVALLAASLLGYGEVKAFIDALSPDGDAERFGRERFESSVRLLRVYAALLCGLGLAVFYFRHDLQDVDLGARSRTLTARLIEYWADTPPVVKVALGACLAVGAAVRWLGADQPIHEDEAWTYVHYATKSLFVVIGEYTSPNNHILHTILAHFSLRLFGNSEAALRIPALIAGMAAIPVAYLLCCRVANRGVGVLASAAVAAWPMLVDYSANARGYTMIVLFTLGLALAADHMRANRSATPFGAYAVLSALGLYTVPSFSLSILTTGFWLLVLLFADHVGGDRLQFLRRLTTAAVAALLFTGTLYAPVLTNVGVAALLGNDVVTGEGMSSVGALQGVQEIYRDWLGGVPLSVGVVASAGFVLFLLRAPARYRAIWLGLLAAGASIAVLQGTMGPPRVWIFALPLFLGCAAWGLLSLVPSRLQMHSALALSGVLLMGSLLLHLASPTRTLYGPTGDFPEARSVVEVLGARIQPGDGLFTDFPTNRITVSYYAKRMGLFDLINDARRVPDDTPSDVLVVVPPGRDVAEAPALHDDVYGTQFQQRTYREIDQIQVGEAQIVVVRFAPMHP